MPRKKRKPSVRRRPKRAIQALIDEILSLNDEQFNEVTSALAWDKDTCSHCFQRGCSGFCDYEPDFG